MALASPKFKRLLFGLTICLSSPLAAEIFSARFDGPTEGPYSRDQAARFLTQASFGPTLEEIERLNTVGYNAWLTEQMAAPASLPSFSHPASTPSPLCSTPASAAT